MAGGEKGPAGSEMGWPSSDAPPAALDIESGTPISKRHFRYGGGHVRCRTNWLRYVIGEASSEAGQIPSVSGQILCRVGRVQRGSVSPMRMRPTQIWKRPDSSEGGRIRSETGRSRGRAGRRHRDPGGHDAGPAALNSKRPAAITNRPTPRSLRPTPKLFRPITMCRQLNRESSRSAGRLSGEPSF